MKKELVYQNFTKVRTHVLQQVKHYNNALKHYKVLLVAQKIKNPEEFLQQFPEYQMQLECKLDCLEQITATDREIKSGKLTGGYIKGQFTHIDTVSQVFWNIYQHQIDTSNYDSESHTLKITYGYIGKLIGKSIASAKRFVQNLVNAGFCSKTVGSHDFRDGKGYRTCIWLQFKPKTTNVFKPFLEALAGFTKKVVLQVSKVTSKAKQSLKRATKNKNHKTTADRVEAKRKEHQRGGDAKPIQEVKLVVDGETIDFSKLKNLKWGNTSSEGG